MAATKAVAPSRPLRKDAARNRALLLTAAREVFAERGLDASLDDVARHAGVGVGTAYRHFANKYELAGAIFEESIGEVLATAEAALHEPDAWQGLVSFLQKTLEMQAADRGLREVLMGVHDDQHEDFVYDRLITPVSALVERAREQGVVRDDFATSDLAMVSMMLCHVADLAGDESPELWRRYLPLVLQSLRPHAIDLDIPPLTDQQLRTSMAAHKQAVRRVSAT